MLNEINIVLFQNECRKFGKDTPFSKYRAINNPTRTLLTSRWVVVLGRSENGRAWHVSPKTSDHDNSEVARSLYVEQFLETPRSDTVLDEVRDSSRR